MLRKLTNLGCELGRGLLQVLYPPACAVCGQALGLEGQPLCGACRAALTAEPFATCPRCGGTVGPFALLEDGCSRCRNSPFHFQQVSRLGPYDGLLRDVILRLKHPTGEGLAEAVGMLWAERAGPVLCGFGAETVIPVPLHWWRRWRRGYNQSEVLSQESSMPRRASSRTWMIPPAGVQR